MKKIRNMVLSAFSVLIFAVGMSADFTTVDGSDIYDVFSGDKRFSYCIGLDGNITIKATDNAEFENKLDIPSSIDGKKVTAIADRAFVGQQNITRVVIPESVEKIGKSAFSNCYKLDKIEIKGTITDIGAYPFFDTPFEKTLKKNGDFIIFNEDILYDYTGSSQNILIPNGIRVISGNLFTYFEDIRDFKINYVSIPDSVENICDGAFFGCDSIGSVIFGSGIKSIGENAFTASDMTVIGYYETPVQAYASQNSFKFNPIVEYGKQSETIYADFSKNFRQFYFTDEKSLSREGVLVYRRNYNGEKIEITDWEYSAELTDLAQ